jgi:streptogramin lyase
MKAGVNVMKALLKSKPVLVAIIVALLVSAMAVPLLRSTVHAHAKGTVTITEFPIPTTNSFPGGITSGSDGALWFAEAVGNIGRITTSGSITEFVLRHLNDLPYQITSGSDGALWFTEGDGNQIGRITTGGSFTEFPIPTPSSYPQAITSGPDGALWFAEDVGNIGRITTSGSFTEFPIPTSRSVPQGITSGPDGALWFTEVGANQIGRITTGGSITEFPIPTANSDSGGITSGSDGNIWFTESSGYNSGNKIGRVNVPHVPSPPATPGWGVDSFSPITSSLYSQVQGAFGTPSFWGRYIGLGAYSDDMTASEVAFAHSNGLAILPVYSDFSQSTVSGYATGQADATVAITAAQQMLAIAPGVAIFVDIEAGSAPDSTFIQGWYDRFNSTFSYSFGSANYTYQAGYYRAGYYGNTRATNAFAQAYCAAIRTEPALAKNASIWTPQPNPGRTTAAAAPPYAPIALPCVSRGPDVWQYGLAGGSSPNVDTDEALSRLPLWQP